MGKYDDLAHFFSELQMVQRRHFPCDDIALLIFSGEYQCLSTSIYVYYVIWKHFEPFRSSVGGPTGPIRSCCAGVNLSQWPSMMHEVSLVFNALFCCRRFYHGFLWYVTVIGCILRSRFAQKGWKLTSFVEQCRLAFIGLLWEASTRSFAVEACLWRSLMIYPLHNKKNTQFLLLGTWSEPSFVGCILLVVGT